MNNLNLKIDSSQDINIINNNKDEKIIKSIFNSKIEKSKSLFNNININKNS